MWRGTCAATGVGNHCELHLDESNEESKKENVNEKMCEERGMYGEPQGLIRGTDGGEEHGRNRGHFLASHRILETHTLPRPLPFFESTYLDLIAIRAALYECEREGREKELHHHQPV